MHWTALLAYRRFPREARVIDDIACIGCGYNLRGLRVSQPCTECGRQVGDSLFVLAKPQLVALGLRHVGKAFLAEFALVLGCLNWSPAWPLIVALVVSSGGAAFRAVGAWQLHSRGAIDKLPVIGSRTLWLHSLTVLDLCLRVCWLVLVIAVAEIPALQGAASERAVTMLGLISISTTMTTAAAAGLLGLALSTMLGHWTRIEFRIQLGALAACALCALPAIVLAAANADPLLVLVAFGVLGLLLASSLVATTIALLHLANAAEHEDEMWDDAVESASITH